MSAETDKPRVFGLPPGVDFAQATVDGIRERLKDSPPHAIAQVQLFANTARMQRRLKAIFDAQTGFLPQLRLVTDLAQDPLLASPAPATSDLARRLELAQLVRKVTEQNAMGFAPSQSFDLANSLADLMSEMQSEGVAPEILTEIDVADHSEHWKRSLQFLMVIQDYLAASDGLDPEARLREATLRQIALWDADPPTHPVIVAGSTASRGTTRLLMEAVAKLPEGALILPGFDRHMPQEAWDELDQPLTGEDHPQFRFRNLLKNLGLTPEDVQDWHDTPPESSARNALVSLALRPAPVTDAWLREGPHLADIDTATQNLTLLEAADPRTEAQAIAIRLRHAAETDETAALITPDRLLTRQVAAALSRWGIVPDDSAGTPLPLTAPGRLLRQTADLMAKPLTAEALLALLKHPFVSAEARGDHLKNTRDAELELMRGGPPFPTRADFTTWAATRPSADLDAWISWLWNVLEELPQKTGPLDGLVNIHVRLTEALVAGPKGTPAELWAMAPGEEALKAIGKLRDAAPFGGSLHPLDYGTLLYTVLGQEEARDTQTVHSGIMIWGTLEARVQGADLVILAGLNDGTWPEQPKPDPWMNRQMRQQAGLLLPERRIGLSAHDFQQAIGAREVWLSRAKRDAEAETVASRWLNRLSNLLAGLERGKPALEAMRARSKPWLEMAEAVDRPTTAAKPAHRPSPIPPPEARPRHLPVTQIETLIRDPYAVYARYVLKLRPLDPLQIEADAPLRGIVLHGVMEEFSKATQMGLPEDALDRLMHLAADLLEANVPWPAMRALWLGRFARTAPWIVESEQARRLEATPHLFETKAEAALDGLDFTLEGRADRIDLTPDGRAVIYDYKSGSLPGKDEQVHFNKQLPLLAALSERAGFAGLGPRPALGAHFIGLGSKPEQRGHSFGKDELEEVWDKLTKLVAQYVTEDKGFSSRRAPKQTTWESPYDQLARFGEWDGTDPAIPEKVGH